MEQKSSVTIRVPATTANLGPGYDCLGMAVDLWNETTFRLQGEGISVIIHGEGARSLPTDESNMIVKTFLEFYQRQNQPFPQNLSLECTNHIPPGSGLGSSGASILAGVLAANEMLGCPLDHDVVFDLANEIEGHPDNLAAALDGGLVMIASQGNGSYLTRRFDTPEMYMVVVVPIMNLPTQISRSVLPEFVLMTDAVFNAGCVPLVIDALRNGDLKLLGQGMHDRLHQPYRLKLIPGGQDAMQAAQEAGAAAVALSGAGPGIIAFCEKPRQAQVAAAMQNAICEAGLSSKIYLLKNSNAGAMVIR